MSRQCADAIKEGHMQTAIVKMLFILILLLGLTACGEQIEPTASAEPKREVPGPEETELFFETILDDYSPKRSGLEYYFDRNPQIVIVARSEDVSGVDEWLPAEAFLSLDYEQYLVIAVFQGCCGAMRDVTVTHVTHEAMGDKLTRVYVEFEVPKPNTEVILEVQSPYHVVKVGKDGLSGSALTMFELIANGESINTYRYEVP